MRFAMVLLLLSLSNAALVFGQNTRATPEVHTTQNVPLVQLQTSQENVNRGERMHVQFVTAQNAFVAILRIDTDGRVRWLYPERPWHDSYVQAGRMLQVRNPACNQGECAFVIDDYPGQGYIFAVTSLFPFDFDTFTNGDYWAYTTIAHRGRVTGDPFVADLGNHRGDQAQQRLLVRKECRHRRSPLDLPVQSLDHVRRSKTATMILRKVEDREPLRDR